MADTDPLAEALPHECNWGGRWGHSRDCPAYHRDAVRAHVATIEFRANTLAGEVNRLAARIQDLAADRDRYKAQAERACTRYAVAVRTLRAALARPEGQ